MGTVVSSTLRQTSHAEIAMVINKTVHAGPNSQLGGVHTGFFRFAYHGRSDGVVRSDPSTAAIEQAAMQIISRIRAGSICGLFLHAC